MNRRHAVEKVFISLNENKFKYSYKNTLIGLTRHVKNFKNLIYTYFLVSFYFVSYWLAKKLCSLLANNPQSLPSHFPKPELINKDSLCPHNLTTVLLNALFFKYCKA